LFHIVVSQDFRETVAKLRSDRHAVVVG
jgi:hypothetical protein